MAWPSRVQRRWTWPHPVSGMSCWPPSSASREPARTGWPGHACSSGWTRGWVARWCWCARRLGQDHPAGRLGRRCEVAGGLVVAGPRRQRPGPLLALCGGGPGARPRRSRRVAPSPPDRSNAAVGPWRGYRFDQPAPGPQPDELALVLDDYHVIEERRSMTAWPSCWPISHRGCTWASAAAATRRCRWPGCGPAASWPSYGPATFASPPGGGGLPRGVGTGAGGGGRRRLGGPH